MGFDRIGAEVPLRQGQRLFEFKIADCFFNLLRSVKDGAELGGMGFSKFGGSGFTFPQEGW